MSDIETVEGRFAERWDNSLPGEGWWPLIIEMDEKLAALAPDFKYHQIKEKFGALRVYIDTFSEEAHAIIADAERRSMEICEFCGEPGEARGGGWVLTLCASCDEERRARRAALLNGANA